MNSPWFIVSVFSLYFWIKSHVSFAAATISANQFLSGDQTIVSGGGVFELGFFKSGNSPNYYIGIWYKKWNKKLSEENIVWVGNRDKPISDRYSSVLGISNGNLVLFNEARIPVWSTNLNPSTDASTEAVLLDDGNLVLRDWSTNSSIPLWQSFDNPTHTFLPGMKFGRNKRTNVTKFLTSWKNKEDPAPGLFSLGPHPDGSDQYVMLWNSSQQYWISGLWNGQTFGSVSEVTYHKSSNVFNVSYVSNENESYFTYSVAATITFQFVMDASGRVHEKYWLDNSSTFQFWSMPSQPCQVYAYCGVFGRCSEQTEPFCDCLSGFKPNLEHDWNLLEDYSGGCQRKTQLRCENNSLANGKSDKFIPMPNMKLPKFPQSVPVASIKQCETTCLSNCSCTAYAYESNQCSIWIENLLNLQQLAQGDTNGKTIYIKVAASEFSSRRNDKGTIIAGVVGSVVFVFLLCLVVVSYLRWKKKTIKVVDGSLVAFAYKDLQKATKNFSGKLGGGGFGSVFSGLLSDSTVIAVKKLESISQGEKQFRAEVRTIGNINHVNVVRLLGFCSEGTRRLLVYQYMPNGSLNDHLFDGKGSNVLDWKTRYRIALGSARGLAYLHEKCRDCIIHCDIKPENILLDAEFCPTVADFGLAKLVGREFSRVLTTIRGTRGYLAPEWISGVAITSKADVFSYGMMLFEIASGRRNSEQYDDENSKLFPAWAASELAEGGNILSLLDPRLEGNADVEELSRICRVACWCIQDDEIHRPSMGQVVQILEGLLDVNQSPIPRSLQRFDDNQEYKIFFSVSSSDQNSPSRSDTSAASSLD